MFDNITVYNIALAEHLGLAWDDQKGLEDAYDTYMKLPARKQIQFDQLIKKAVFECKSDFNCFPETHLNDMDMEIHNDIKVEISKKIEDIFGEFLLP